MAGTRRDVKQLLVHRVKQPAERGDHEDEPVIAIQLAHQGPLLKVRPECRFGGRGAKDFGKVHEQCTRRLVEDTVFAF